MLLSLVALLAGLVVALAVWLADLARVYYLMLVVLGLGLSVAEALAIRWIDRNGEWGS
jgi:hypothetical protein